LGNTESVGKQRETEFTSPTLSAFDIANLSFRKATQFRELELAQAPIKPKLSDPDSETGLYALHTEKV